MSDELEPCLIFHEKEGQAIFATWRLESGEETLAVFSSEEFAEKYKDSHLSAEW